MRLSEDDLCFELKTGVRSVDLWTIKAGEYMDIDLSGFCCLIFVASGEGNAEIGQEQWKLRSEYLSLIPAGSAPSIRINALEEPLSLFLVRFRLTIWETEGFGTGIPRMFRIDEPKNMVGRFQTMLFYSRKTEHNDVLHQQAALLKVLSDIAEECPAFLKSDIDPVLRYIDTHMAEKIRLEDLAVLAGGTSGRLRQVFRKRYGVSPHEYILQTRLSHARRMLKHTDKSIQEIAAKIGFDHANYFSRIFRQKIGCSPMEYRKNNKM